MVNDLSNKETLILNFIKEMLKSKFPNLDVSDEGAFMEQFGTPHVKLLMPLLEEADRIKLTQSLDNADLMTEEEMDELANNRYFTFRNAGDYSVGYATISFDDIPANGVIQIPSGAEAESKQGLRFRSNDTIVLSEEGLANYYDPDNFQYNIPVFFIAENPGAAYNIKENELTKMVTPLPHLAEITNNISFTGGVDKETNLELANRIKETAGTPNVGVERGWKLWGMKFTDVKDIIVAGMGHPLMQRDIIGITPPGRFSSHVDPNVHWGGKIDLHIRGKKLAEHVDTKQLTLNEDGELVVELSKHPTEDVVEITFTSSRYTDPDLDPSFFIARDFLLMKDENRETIGTLNEKSWVIVMDDRLDATDVVSVRYRYNQLIEDMNNSLYEEDNRPPASDVLLKEAKKKYIHSAMVLRLDTVIGIQEKDRSIIRQRLYNWINQMGTGTEIQFSDLNAPIYENSDDSIDTKVDYISLPSQFIVTDYHNKYLFYSLDQDKRDFLEKVQEQSMYFAQWISYFKDNVTIDDFFDLMHALTYQNVEKDAWKNLSFRDHIWGKKVNYINVAKRMLAYVNSIQRLSPSKWTTEQNNYFELGNLMIYEDVQYAESELENVVTLFETIANPGEIDYNTDNILHLTVFCSVMLYVMSSENTGGMNVEDLFDWLLDLTKGTPIDYMVHH